MKNCTRTCVTNKFYSLEVLLQTIGILANENGDSLIIKGGLCHDLRGYQTKRTF